MKAKRIWKYIFNHYSEAMRVQYKINELVKYSNALLERSISLQKKIKK